MEIAFRSFRTNTRVIRFSSTDKRIPGGAWTKDMQPFLSQGLNLHNNETRVESTSLMKAFVDLTFLQLLQKFQARPDKSVINEDKYIFEPQDFRENVALVYNRKPMLRRKNQGA